MSNNFSTVQKDDLISKLRTVTIYTELSGVASKVTSFSYAGANSSYSYGILQFDVKANVKNANFLKSIGFTSEEVTLLSSNGGLSSAQLQPLNAKLQAHIPELDAYTGNTMAVRIATLNNVIDYVSARNPAMGNTIKGDPGLQLAIMDFDNQFHISGLNDANPPSVGMLAYLCGKNVTLPGGTVSVGATLERSDIQNFINKTAYGVNNATSVARRASDLEKGLTLALSGQKVTTDTSNKSAVDSFAISLDGLTGDLSSFMDPYGVFSAAAGQGTISSKQQYSSLDCSHQMSYINGSGTEQWSELGVYNSGKLPEVTLKGSGAPLYTSNGKVYLYPNTNAYVEGSGNKVTYGLGCTITVGGNGQNSDDAALNVVTRDPLVSADTSTTVNILPNSRVNVFGNNSQINGSTADNFGAVGDNLTINAGAGSGVWVGGNGQMSSGIDNIYTNGAVVTLLDNTRANVFAPTGSVIYAGKNANFGAMGAGINAYLDSGSNIWIGQNGKAGAVNTVYGSSSGGAITLLDNSNVAVTGSNNSVYMATLDNVSLSGGNNVINTTATGTTPGAGNSLFIANTGTLSDVINVAGSTNANGGGITMGSNTSAIIKGGGNTVVLQDGVTVSEYGAGNMTVAGTRDHIYIEDGSGAMNQVKGTGLDMTAAASGQAGGIYTAANTKLAVWGGHDLIKAGTGSTISDYFAGNTPDVIVGDYLSINSLGGMLDIIGTHNVLTGSYDKYRAQGTYNELHDGSLYGGTDFNTMQFYGSDITGDKGGTGLHDVTNYYIGQTIPDWFFSGIQGLAVQSKTNDLATLSATLWNKSPDWVPGSDVQRPNWQPGNSPVTTAALEQYANYLKEHGHGHGPNHQGNQVEMVPVQDDDTGILVIGLRQDVFYV